MTIIQPKRKTGNKFLCIVKRRECFNVFYTPERWECWVVLADTFIDAIKIAQYHFYGSNKIFVTDKPYIQQ